MATILKNLHRGVFTIVCGVKNPYCTECCRPDCALSVTPEDDNSLCSFPPSESFTEAKSCFFSDQAILETMIKLKTDISQQRDVIYADDDHYDERFQSYNDW